MLTVSRMAHLECVGVCPMAALKPKREYLLEEGLKPDQILALHAGRRKMK